MLEANWIPTEWKVYCPECKESMWYWDNKERYVSCCKCGCRFLAK